MDHDKIAENMGISTASLKSMRKKHEEINEALSKTRDVSDYEVEYALFKKALGGDTSAMTFWLKNRKPKVWRDKQPEDEAETMAAIQALIDSNTETAKIILKGGKE